MDRGRKEVIRKYVLVKQGVDLQCNTIAQMVISAYLEKYDIDAHIDKYVKYTGNGATQPIEAIHRAFPSDIKFTRPEGGLFLWIELNEKTDTVKLLEKCLEHNVAFVPGNSFFPNTKKRNTLRINFSNMPEDKISDGIMRMGKALKEFTE